MQLYRAVQDDVGLIDCGASEQHEEDHGAAAVSFFIARKQGADQKDQQQYRLGKIQ